jgi:LAO/AO transport system kinase
VATPPSSPPDELARRVEAGDRRALSRAITLVESSRGEDAPLRRELLRALLPVPTRDLTLAVTGVPGAGKSTLVDALGRRFLAAGHRVAVLAVDPSSTRSGGSVLGDKTRMAELARSPDVFIRPSPTSGTYGGAAPRTREALLLCRAAGFDRIVFESVGVGQSEHDASRIADVVVYVTLAGAGDELQGLKRGALEHADVVAFNKADGEARERVVADAERFGAALSLLRPQAPPAVLAVSAVDGTGLDALFAAIEDRYQSLVTEQRLTALRARQAEAWFEAELDREVKSRVLGSQPMRQRLAVLKESVARGAKLPGEAVAELLDELLPETKP